MRTPTQKGTAMSENNGTAPQPDSPFGKFKELTRKLVSVPKAEIDAKERAYQRQKAREKRRST